MPQISKQFRGLEDLLESQERQDRINFVGSDISPVIRVDPPSLDLATPTLESGTVTGVATVVNLSTVPAGFYREIIQCSANHDDPANILFVDVILVRDADSSFIALRDTIGTMTNAVTLNLFGQEHKLFPPGWHLRVTFPALAAGQIATVKTLSIDRALGLGALM